MSLSCPAGLSGDGGSAKAGSASTANATHTRTTYRSTLRMHRPPASDDGVAADRKLGGLSPVVNARNSRTLRKSDSAGLDGPRRPSLGSLPSDPVGLRT